MHLFKGVQRYDLSIDMRSMRQSGNFGRRPKPPPVNPHNEPSDAFGLQKMTEALTSGRLDDHEAVIKEMIVARVTELLSTNPDLLMSYLYRLDVLEPDIQRVLKLPSSEPIVEQLATLIWDRQVQRIKTKRAYKRSEDIDDELSWP